MIIDMGLMSKLNKMKSFLFDEEEEKEEKKPLKKVNKKEVKTLPKEENKTSVKNDIEELYFEDISEPDIPVKTEIASRVQKKESEFNFPEFDDDDFMVANKKPEPIIPVQKEEPKRVLYQGSKRKEETKKFKPSPIISPIYGLLDSDGNTIKEESSSESSQSYNDDVSFDEVRKKAYGKLDEEIENTMKRLSKKTIEEAENEMELEEELSRSKKKSSKAVKEQAKTIITHELDDEDDDDMILPNVNFKEIDVDKESLKSEKKDLKKTNNNSLNSAELSNDDDDDDDDTKEQDLFNLIDTMYQNKEDED